MRQLHACVLALASLALALLPPDPRAVILARLGLDDVPSEASDVRTLHEQRGGAGSADVVAAPGTASLGFQGHAPALE
jgi:hypothetical protein